MVNFRETLQRWCTLKTLCIALPLAVILYIYLPCALLVLYNYLWWPVYSGTVRLAVASQPGDNNLPVPKILHQTWKDKDVPEKWKAAQQACIAAHPGYEYKLWTDADAEKVRVLTRPPRAAQRAHAQSKGRACQK